MLVFPETRPGEDRVWGEERGKGPGGAQDKKEGTYGQARTRIGRRRKEVGEGG